MAKPWADDELDVLRRLYPTGGSAAVHAALPHRPVRSIKVIAHMRGVTCDVHYWGGGSGRKPVFSHDAIMSAFVDAGHNATAAAAALGCHRETVRAAVERDRHARRMAAIAHFNSFLEAA